MPPSYTTSGDTIGLEGRKSRPLSPLQPCKGEEPALTELENTRHRRAVSDLTLDKLILTEAARGNY